MSIIICGVTSGVNHKYRCPCCGDESDDIEYFAISMCWDCVSGNWNCAHCLERGVEVTWKSPTEDVGTHRLGYFNDDGAMVTECLRVVDRDLVWPGTTEPICDVCWPIT